MIAPTATATKYQFPDRPLVSKGMASLRRHYMFEDITRWPGIPLYVLAEHYEVSIRQIRTDIGHMRLCARPVRIRVVNRRATAWRVDVAEGDACAP